MLEHVPQSFLDDAIEAEANVLWDWTRNRRSGYIDTNVPVRRQVTAKSLDGSDQAEMFQPRRVKLV